MSIRLRVLLVDENSHDRGLVLRQLKREFAAVEAVEVADAISLERALDEGGFDLVITDRRLRRTDGVQVLRAVRDRYPQCPVIMYTATGSEEIAVDAMKNGLDDYIIKSPDHLKRLPAAVRSVLEGAAARRKAEMLRSRLERLLRQLNVGVFRCTPEGRLLEANAAFWQVLRMDTQDAAAAIDDERLSRARRKCSALFRHVLKTGESREKNLSLQDAEGRSFWVRITATAVDMPDNQTVIEGLVEDVTERKRVEEAARLRSEAAGRLARLSPREFEVLQHVVAGRPNKAIARRMRISEKTVEKHRSKLMKKLKVSSVAGLVRLAITAEPGHTPQSGGCSAW